MGIILRGAGADERSRYATLVRPARLRLGMSQLELARIAGVDRTTVSNVERAAGAPQGDVLRRLLLALGLVSEHDEDEDVEIEGWTVVLGRMLHAIPTEARAVAADEAIAALAPYLRDLPPSEVPDTVRRIAETMRGDDAHGAMAAKRGAARRQERHAE